MSPQNRSLITRTISIITVLLFILGTPGIATARTLQTDGRGEATPLNAKEYPDLIAAGISFLQNKNLNTTPTLEARSQRLLRTGSGVYILAFSFADESNFGGTTVYFTSEGTPTDYTEIVMTPLSKTSGHAKIWENGMLVIDKTASATDPETPENKGDMSTLGLDWSGFNKCLSEQGIAGWAVALLGSVCGVICVGTAGLGCFFCLGNATAIAGITIEYCFYHNWN